jgi:hypothetical protein
MLGRYFEGATVNLHSLARSYLEAGGYQVRRTAAGFLDLAHPEATGGRPARVLVWSDDTTFAPPRALTASERAERDQREQALLAGFRKEMAAAPGAVGCFLVAGTRGLSATFAKSAPTVLQGGIRVPVQFFDTGYRVDSARGGKVRSALGMVLDHAARTRRAAQPFLIRRGLEPEDCTPGGADLVEHLETALADPGRGARVRFIVGAAGSGKTVAFNALLRASFDEFMAAKTSARPSAPPPSPPARCSTAPSPGTSRRIRHSRRSSCRCGASSPAVPTWPWR